MHGGRGENHLRALFRLLILFSFSKQHLNGAQLCCVGLPCQYCLAVLNWFKFKANKLKCSKSKSKFYL